MKVSGPHNMFERILFEEGKSIHSSISIFKHEK